MENNITKMVIENKPSSINYAYRIILFSIFAGIVNLAVEFYSGTFYYYSTYGIIVFSSIIILIIYYIASKIRRGKNWARYLFLILFITGIPNTLPGIIKNFDRDFLTGLLNFIILVSDAAVLILLFSKPSNEWFRKIKNSRTR